jgi:hypothetical protein
MPYTGQPATVQTDEVRLLLGDTNPALPNLSDAEIAYFLAQGNNVSVVAAYLAAQALITKYSQKISASIGRVATVNYATLVAQLKELSATLVALGGRPSSLNMGPPVDQSSQVPGVLSEQRWENDRVW